MKRVTGMLAVLVSVCVAGNSFAGLPDSFRNKGAHKELRVTGMSGVSRVMKNANVGDGTILGDSLNVPFGDVTRLESMVGNHSTSGTVWGSIIGGGIGIAVAMGTKKTETKDNGWFQEETTTIQTWPIYLFTLAGGLIGAAAGSSSHTYTTLYNEGAHTPPAGQSHQLKLGVAPGSGGWTDPPYVTLSCRF